MANYPTILAPTLIPMRLSLLVLIVHVAMSSMVQGQKSAEEILTLPAEQQINAIWNYHYPGVVNDTTAMLAYLVQLQHDFEEKKKYTHARQAWLVRVDYLSNYLHLYKPYGIAVLNEAIAEAHTRGWNQLEAECTLRKGFLLFKQNKYGPAFESMHKGYEGIKKGGFENSPLIIPYLEELALHHFSFGDTEGAIHYLREALALPNQVDVKGGKRKTLNTIGTCFNRLNLLDSAFHYFSLAHDVSVAVKDTFWAALTGGNMGNVLFLQQQYDRAIPLLETDFKISNAYGEYPSAVNAALSLATIYIKQGNSSNAEEYLKYADRAKNTADVRHMSGFYKNMATISRLKGNEVEAFAYQDSFLLYKERDDRERSAQTVNQARLKVEVDQYTNEIRRLEDARGRQVLLRNGLILILVLSGIFVMLLFHQQRLRRQKEKQLAALREEAARAELEHAKKQLSTFTQALKEKNDLIDTFRSELEQIHHTDDMQSKAREAQITRLLQATILTEEDWRDFRHMFDMVYPGFFIRLKEKLNDLTPAETRLLALTKLQLAPKDMASMLGISYDAIKKSRQRLRKKIHLPEEGTLDELVELI